jgi:Domain of unknown function (DUF4326)
LVTRVVNKYKERFYVYIGRPSKWGNPYSVKKYGRDRAIEMYIDYIMAKPELLKLIPIELKDKTLGCFCKPKSCHGDILAGLADDPNLI